LVLLKVAIKEKEQDVIKYKNEFKIPLPLLIDENGSVANAYGVWSHPETFFINREGKIVGRVLKDMDWTSRSMRSLIQYLLKENK
jgi:peroxiredoxin